MKPEAIMKFLEISGRFIIDFQTREHSNISKITIANDKKGKELSDFLLQGNDATTLFSVEGHTLYWQTNKI
jgi:hypothetical protein